MIKRKLYPVVVGCSTAILFVCTKSVRAFLNAILKRFSLEFHKLVEFSWHRCAKWRKSDFL